MLLIPLIHIVSILDSQSPLLIFLLVSFLQYADMTRLLLPFCISQSFVSYANTQQLVQGHIVAFDAVAPVLKKDYFGAL